MPLLVLALGLGITTLGAEAFVAGASRLARALRVPSVLIGLTVVSLGTSASEIAVALSAITTDHATLALGNIIGSNICNVLLILGLAASIKPLRVADRLVRFDVPVMILVSLLVFGASLDGDLSRVEGVAALVLAVLYFAALFRARATPIPRQDPRTPSRAQARPMAVGMVAVGTLLLFIGARFVVSGATDAARALGASELVVGLTILAFGTSVPELAATISSLRRGETDLVVGNIVGSNVVNLLVVLGLTAVAAGAPLPAPIALLSFDLPVLCVVAFACLPVFFTHDAIERWEGAVFLLYYALYVAYVVLDQTGHGDVALHRIAILAFIVPLFVMTVAIVLRRHRPWA